MIRELLAGFPRELHRRAEKRRTVAWAHEVEWRAEGMPQKWIDRQNAWSLAVADLLDALAGRS